MLDLIERVGNKVPHPVLMFLYLIIGVIVALDDAGVLERPASPSTSRSPCRSASPPDYFGDPIEPIVADMPPDARTRTSSRKRPSPSRACCPSMACGSSSPRSCPTSRASRWWASRSSRSWAPVSPRRRGSWTRSSACWSRYPPTGARVRAHPRGRPVERRLRCRLPDPHPAGRRGVHERRAAPAGGPRGVLRGRGLRSSASTCSRAPSTRRSLPSPTRPSRSRTGAHHHRLQLWFSHHLVDRAGHHRGHRHRAHRREAAGPMDGRRRRRASATLRPSTQRTRQRGLKRALVSVLGYLAIVLLLTLPPGAPAAGPGHRRHHRPHPVHGQPDVHHHDGVPGGGHRLRLRGGHVQALQRRHRRGDQDLRRARRADLHAPDDRPVHRHLQLQPDAHRAGDDAVAGAGGRPHRRACRCSSG